MNVMKINTLFMLFVYFLHSCGNKAFQNEPLNVQIAHEEDIVIDVTQNVYFYTEAYYLDEKKSKHSLDSVVTYLSGIKFNNIEVDVISKYGTEYDLTSVSVMSGRIRNYLILKGVNKGKVFANWSVSESIKNDFSILLKVKM